MHDPSKVVFVETEIPHYRVGTLNELNRSIGGRLVVLAGRCRTDSHLIEGDEHAMEFQLVRIPSRWFLGNRLLWLNYFRALAIRPTEAIIARDLVRSVWLLPFLAYCRLIGVPLLLWGQGYSRKRKFRPFRNPADFVHLVKAKLAKGYITYTSSIAENLGQWIPRNKLFVANNTVHFARRSPDVKQDISQRLETASQGPIELLFVGRLQKRKKVDLLLKALAELRTQSNRQYRLSIIGDGELKGELQALAGQLELVNIEWFGNLREDQVAPYLRKSHVVVIPGWLGLAVNHAFSFGVPVVTEFPNETLTNHPPEIEYFHHHQNGYAYQADNPSDLARAIEHVVADLNRFSESALATYSLEMSIDSMMSGFKQSLEFVHRST